MRLGKLPFLTIASLLLCALAAAQTQPTESDADKEKKQKEQNERVVKMLGQAISEGGGLRLPNNRAIIYALSADMYWKFDEKRARELFRSSADEIIAYLVVLDKERREDPDANGTYVRDDLRDQILPLIAKHDAEMALEMLLQTRPAKLMEAMAKAAGPNAKTRGDMMRGYPEGASVKDEVALEQRFALMAADENPDKAIKLIKESIAKGISPYVLLLLQKLNKKEEKKAAELAGDVIKKIGQMDLEKDLDAMRTAMYLLEYADKPELANAPADGSESSNGKNAKIFKFSPSQAKDIAAKIADVMLSAPKTMTMGVTFTQVKPLLEKYLPEKLPLLRLHEADVQANLPPEIKDMLQRGKLWDSNATPEETLTRIAKMETDYEKENGYEVLLKKIGELEDDTRAKKLIDQITDDKYKAVAMEQFESARITRTAADGKLDDARKLIGNLTKRSNQIRKLVALAIEFQRKGGEKDMASAKSLMKDAKSLTNSLAETSDDIADVMEVIKGYAAVEPDIAFRMFEPIVDKVNEFIQASATVHKFTQNRMNFTKGELVLSASGYRTEMPPYPYIPQIQLLAKADLDRMNAIADKFDRLDTRLIVRLFVLQGFLKDDKKPEETGTPFDPTD